MNCEHLLNEIEIKSKLFAHPDKAYRPSLSHPAPCRKRPAVSGGTLCLNYIVKL